MSKKIPMPSKERLKGYCDHLTIQEVANVYGVGKRTVCRWKEFHGLTEQQDKKAGFAYKNYTPEKYQIQALIENMTIQEAVKALDINRRTFYRWMKKHGITPPPADASLCISSQILEESDIPLIRALKGELPANEVAEKFEISSRAIHDVWSGRTWKHVSDTLVA